MDPEGSKMTAHSSSVSFADTQSFQGAAVGRFFSDRFLQDQGEQVGKLLGAGSRAL